MYRLVQKSSVYSISEPQEHAVQFVFFSPPYTYSLFKRFPKRVDGECHAAWRLRIRRPPSKNGVSNVPTRRLPSSSSFLLPPFPFFPLLPSQVLALFSFSACFLDGQMLLNPSLYLSPGRAHSAGPQKRCALPLLKVVKTGPNIGSFPGPLLTPCWAPFGRQIRAKIRLQDMFFLALVLYPLFTVREPRKI